MLGEIRGAGEIRGYPAVPVFCLEIGAVEVYLDALSRYGRTKVHFVDCSIAAAAKDQRVSVATFDQDFRKFPDVRVELGCERRPGDDRAHGP